MTRMVILFCTGRGTHVEQPETVLTITLPDDVEPTEYVRWTPVPAGARLDVDCRQCGRTWWLGRARGWLLGGLERHSRTVGRVEFDLSQCRDLDSS